MPRTNFRWLLPAACAVVSAASLAQGAPAAPLPIDPLDAKAQVPAYVYRSALTAYRRQADAAPVPWGEANERVGKIGGWRAYAREANMPDPAENPPAGGPTREKP